MSRFSLALPTLVLVVADLWRRGDRLWLHTDWLHALGYVATATVASIAWGAMLFAASRRTRVSAVASGVFIATYGMSSAVQDEFFTRYNVYLALDAQLDAESIPWAVVGSLPLTWTFAMYTVLWLAIAGACVEIAKIARRARTRSSASPWLSGGLVAAALVLLTAIPTSYRGAQSSTPDVLYLHALRVGIAENLRESLGGEPRPARQQLRHPHALPALGRAPAAPRNVVVIMQEAVRFDVHDARAPSRREAPNRIELREMRAVSSSTAVALATTWTGLPATARRGALFSAPLVWDYAHAAGYRTGYWTSQHPMFANTRLSIQGAPRDHCVWATELDPLADYLIGADDELAVARALSDLRQMGEPFFGVVHLSNAHMPRRFDPDRAPFQPSDDHYRRQDTPTQRNFYKNAVHVSELAVAELLRGIREAPWGERTVVVYLSDHGEAWLEHEQNNDHGSTLFDEEIRIPAWIDAPTGTLSPSEEEHLRAARDTPVFQTAVTPTILDLLGVWDAIDHTAMPDTPLTRAAVRPRFHVLTNVSWAWEYGDPNWGLMRGDLKLLATSTDEAYRCYDLDADPLEKHDLGASACGDLEAIAHDVFGMLPRDLGRLRTHPDWGWP